MTRPIQLAGMLLLAGTTTILPGLARGQAGAQKCGILSDADGKAILRIADGPPAGIGFSLRFCPPGKVAPFLPESNTFDVARTRDVGPFLISEREITQGVFFAVLEKAGLAAEFKAWHEAKSTEADGRRVTRDEYYKSFANDDVTGMGNGKPRYVGDELPMYGVSIQEAAFFCRALDKLYRRGIPGGIYTFRFRLPTADEWQYACRAATTVEAAKAYPDFNRWPELAKIEPAIKLATEDLWKKIARNNEPFKGDQTQMVQLLETNGKSADKNDVAQFQQGVRSSLSEFLKVGMGLHYNFNERESLLSAASASSTLPNAWTIYDMHGSVAEWNLENIQDWDQLQTPNDGMVFYSAGGHCFRSGQGDGWKEFTVWGAPRRTYSQSMKRDEFKTSVAGIRLVADLVARPNPGPYIREALAPESGVPDKAKVRAKIAQLNEELAVLQSTAPAEAKKLFFTLRYYQAVAYRGIGDVEEAAQALKEASAEVKPEQKDFLDQIEYQLNREKRLP